MVNFPVFNHPLKSYSNDIFERTPYSPIFSRLFLTIYAYTSLIIHLLLPCLALQFSSVAYYAFSPREHLGEYILSIPCFVTQKPEE